MNYHFDPMGPEFLNFLSGSGSPYPPHPCAPPALPSLAAAPAALDAGLGNLAPRFASKGTDSGIYKAITGAQKVRERFGRAG
mgnify:CR=1 FL=1